MNRTKLKRLREQIKNEWELQERVNEADYVIDDDAEDEEEEEEIMIKNEPIE